MNISNIKVNNQKQKGELLNKLEDYADVVSAKKKIFYLNNLFIDIILDA